MLDSFIIGVLSTIVLGGFYCLFKTVVGKTHVQVQTGCLIFLAILLLLVFFLSFSVYEEFPILLLPILTVVLPGEVLLVRKIIKNVDRLQRKDFDDKEE